MSTAGGNVPFTARVKDEQEKRGSRAQYQRKEDATGWPDTVTPDLERFIATMRSFYLGTASAEGQPYIQHRGGPPGFLVPLDSRTLGFADYGGNKQYITLGNLAENPRAFIFLMDYARRIRIKLWGRARVVEDDAELLEQLSRVTSSAPERCIVFEIAAWDRNCPQHIPQLLPAADVESVVNDLRQRIALLEAENARLSSLAGRQA